MIRDRGRLPSFQATRRRFIAIALAAPIVLVVSAAALAGGPPATIPVNATLPATKQATVDAYTALVAREKANAAPANPNWSPIPIANGDVVQLIPHHAAGAGELYDGATQLPGQTGIVVANVWVERQPGRIVEVYAGGVADDPTLGVITVAIWNSSRAVWLGGGSYWAPAHHGSLAIIDAAGEALALRAADGSTVTFDAVTDAFR